MGIFSISFHQNTLCITSYNQKLISRSIKHLTEQNCCKWWSKGFLCGVFYRLCLHLVPHSNVSVIRRVFFGSLISAAEEPVQKACRVNTFPEDCPLPSLSCVSRPWPLLWLYSHSFSHHPSWGAEGMLIDRSFFKALSKSWRTCAKTH